VLRPSTHSRQHLLNKRLAAPAWKWTGADVQIITDQGTGCKSVGTSRSSVRQELSIEEAQTVTGGLAGSDLGIGRKRCRD
jgi:hypothetical protein